MIILGIILQFALGKIYFSKQFSEIEIVEEPKPIVEYVPITDSFKLKIQEIINRSDMSKAYIAHVYHVGSRYCFDYICSDDSFNFEEELNYICETTGKDCYIQVVNPENWNEVYKTYEKY